MTATFTRIFAGHPYRMAAAGALVLAGLALAWYLGSPLFLTTRADEALPLAAEAKVLTRGELGFIDNLHNGKGEVRLIQVGSKRFVRFESVAITNAPDIHIYLSKDTGGKYVEANSLYLGPLKATNGSFNYEIPASADLAPYKSVVAWCRNFSTLITWADLR
ncbi:MAG: DM13 domain-containing protein [Chloroflexi bacterium]|nr:DM13 domain-containing protein [Chloroflexota bacterium]MDQ3400771.1 DM13 domain-containing protein [Chloroflexota bacterium]